MRLRPALCSAIVGVVLTCTVSAAWAQRATFAMLDTLEHGLWEIRDRSGPTERICLRDARVLIQYRHPGKACERVVVEDSPENVAVQYSCPGNGNGHTTVRRETSRLIQFESQGVAGGAPFVISGEARRIGPC